MRSHPARLVLLLLSSFVATGRVLAEEQDASHRERVDQARVRPYREAAISPDGKRVSWVEGLAGEGGEPSSQSAIYIADLANGGGTPRRIAAGDGKVRTRRTLCRLVARWRAARVPLRPRQGGPAPGLRRSGGGRGGETTDVGDRLPGRPAVVARRARLGVLFTQDASKAAGPLQPGDGPNRGDRREGPSSNG